MPSVYCRRRIRNVLVTVTVGLLVTDGWLHQCFLNHHLAKYHLSPVHTGNKVKFDTVDFVQSRPCVNLCRPCYCGCPHTLVTKSKGHSTFGRQKSPTFDKVDRVGDNVDRDKLSNSTFRQCVLTGDKSKLHEY